MKNIFLILISLSLPLFGLSQDRTLNQLYLTSGVSVPSDIVGKDDFTGTPFLNNSWADAIVKTQKGEVYKNIKVKFSIAENQLYFLGEDNMTMKFVLPIKEFSIFSEPIPQVFKSGFPKIANLDGSSFYQILAEGKISMLKKVTKRIIENREYNSAITKGKYVDNVKYFIFDNSTITELKRDKKFIDANFAKNVKVNNYLKENNVDFKNENHLIKLINFYNSIL